MDPDEPTGGGGGGGAAAEFTFGASPPDWLVAAAADGYGSVAELAQRTSLEQGGGPIDALEVDGSLLAEYDRWLRQAARRSEYRRERHVEAGRLEAVRQNREEHRQHGAALQRAAWRQRGQIHEERSKLVRINQAKGLASKREAAQRHEEKRWREARWESYARGLHDEVAEVSEDVRYAKALSLECKKAGARTLRAATGAIERRKTEMEAAKEAEARAVRDAVRSAGTVRVSPETAALVEASAGFKGSAAALSARRATVLSNPDSVLAQPVSARVRRSQQVHGVAASTEHQEQRMLEC